MAFMLNTKPDIYAGLRHPSVQLLTAIDTTAADFGVDVAGSGGCMGVALDSGVGVGIPGNL